jgi:hypothetical protein
MQTNELSIGGAVTVWKSSSTNRDSLLKKMRDLGLGDFVPEPTTSHLALRNALRSVFGVEKVKTLPGFANFAVIDAIATRDNWSGQSSLTVKSGINNLVFSEATDRKQRIESLFEEEKKNIPSTDISKMLVKLAYHVGGVPCASGAGGAYWIPKNSLELWKGVGRSVEAASSTGRSRLYMFTTAMDDEAIRAVVGSLEDNIAKELSDMEAEISSGRLKKRALESRERRAGELRERIRSYESMLGVTIQKLHKAVEHTKKNSVIAALQSLV